jgi:hypothetical protein
MEKKPTIGFVSTPAWFDPAPSEFAAVVEEDVRTQQAPLLLPESEARSRNESMAKAANIPTVMTSLAIVDGLRSLGVKKVAVNCTYYETDICWLRRNSSRIFLDLKVIFQ